MSSKHNHKKSYFGIFQLINLRFLLLFFIQIKKEFTQYLESLQKGVITEAGSLIDISDYYNLSLIITTDKKIYTGIPPSLNSTTNSKIMDISSAVTYNKKYILMACTEDYLLSKINIETGQESVLIPYGNFNIPNCTCSLSTKYQYAFIGISHIVTPEQDIPNITLNETIITQETINNIKASEDLTEIYTAIFSDASDTKALDYLNDFGSYLENTVLKIKFTEYSENEEPILDPNFQILNYTFEYKHYFLDQIPMPRPFLCEIIDVKDIPAEDLSEEPRLVCGFIAAKKLGENSFEYLFNTTVMNINFDKIDDNKLVATFKTMLYIRLQRIDSYRIRYIVTTSCYEISLKKDNSKYLLQSTQHSFPFSQFSSSGDLFYYHNYYLFSALSGYIYIRKQTSNKNYLYVRDNESIKKIMGYFRSETDILIVIYENYSNKIKYFTIENMNDLFSFETKTLIKEVKSNDTTIVNVSEIITNPKDHHLLLSNSSLIYYINTRTQSNHYDNYIFDKDTQLLTIYGSLNDWITFFFYYSSTTNGLSAIFHFENAKVTIKTCLFKCGQCFTNFSTCDEGTCKSNFSLYEDSFDQGCFPIEQNYPNYIFNKTTNFFERCFNSCTFCSLNGKFSSNEQQNCKVCQEGYLKSYTSMGNCYPIEYPYNTSNYSKIFDAENRAFKLVNNCWDLGKLKINENGECVDSCPKTTLYHTYKLNESFDYSKQEESYIGLLYPVYKESPPQYKFNKVCYTSCPKLTYYNRNAGECKCSYGWHYDSTLNESICYDKDYCLSIDYYYHTDDKECVLNDCKEGYYKINRECYKDKCPDNSKLISSELKTCQFKSEYCIIDDHYKTKCNSKAFDGYKLRFNETNLYFKSCNESLYYFDIKTYLYKRSCYQFCPEETHIEEANDTCICNYYIHYLDQEKSDYECIKETEKCWDKKRYNISDRKECVDTIEECTNKAYKVFNDECLTNCPDNTEENQQICLCKYNYYNESNFLYCFDEGKTCESEGYSIKMNNGKECFKNKNECIKRGLKFYQNECYESCPEYTLEKNKDGICSCPNYYFNDSDILTCFNEGETCETKGYSYTNMDTKECFESLDVCITRGLKIFNDNCYNSCPTNTKNGDASYCICKNYFYTDDNNKLNCFDSDQTCMTVSTEYPFKSSETKECFKTKEKCINKGLKVFNYDCLLSSCPENTEDKNNNNICLCSKYSLLDEESLFKCFPSEKECASKGYYFNKETKECFLAEEGCTQNNKKLLGKECVSICPQNSKIKENSNICECSNYFYNDNGILNCFSPEKTCKSEGYAISSADTKECFSSINDCYLKNHLYYFDNKCYKDSCPSDKIPLNSLDINKQNALIGALNLDTSINTILCICDTNNYYYGWVNKGDSSPIVQKCVHQCPTEYDLDENTKKCTYLCDPRIHYVFNNICYKSECPEGTHLDPSNPTSRECICEDISHADINTGLITCEEIYPQLFYEDHDNCPFIYKKNCCLECPEGTCLSPNNKDLAKCIDFKQDMKIYNYICIDKIDELLEKLEDGDEDLAPIVTPSGVVLNIFSADESMEDFIEKYPNLTFVDLGECKDKIKEANNLPEDQVLYILGIDSPCLYGNSSVNVFNYEIYLKNRTQIKDLSPCDNISITISSSINNLDSVHFNKAIDFYKEGYDIYNRSNIFYLDPCAPAQDKGNDITLVDRAHYYFPNVSLCNEGCIYKVIDFDNKRFLCDCNADLNDKEYKKKDYNTPEEEDDSSYLDYFLSLINYRIFLCINLFFEFKSFYYNAGFYISFCTLLVCILLCFLFWIIGIKYIKVLIYKNIPTKEKLIELLKRKRKNLKKRKEKKRNTKKSRSKTYRVDKKSKEINVAKVNNNRRKKKYSTVIGAYLLNKNNPPPRFNNILKLNEYINSRKKLRNKNEKEDHKFTNIIKKNIEIISVSDKEVKSGQEKGKIKEKKKSKKDENIISRRINKNKTTFVRKRESFSSKDNCIVLKNTLMKNKNEGEEEEKENPNILETKKDEELEIRKGDDSPNSILDEGIEDENIENTEKRNNNSKEKKLRKSEKKEKKTRKEKPQNKSSSQIPIPCIIDFGRLIIDNKRYNTEIVKIKYNIIEKEKEKNQQKNHENYERNESNKSEDFSASINNKEEMANDLDLKIDFNYDHLIDRKDDDVDKRELNNIPYRQALRIDKRSFWNILFSILTNQIEFISLFLYRNPYSHYTLTFSVYLFELLLDLTMNGLLYTDEVVSEKYHNNGNLSMFTTLSLSFISNIVSSIIVFFIAKLTNYPDIIESIVYNVKDKSKYIENVVRLFKYIKLRLGLFYILQISFILVMTYYLFIFCTVYHQSQPSIMVNYIVGAFISLAISVGLSLIISILRTIGIKYHYCQTYNVSKYLYEHF